MKVADLEHQPKKTASKKKDVGKAHCSTAAYLLYFKETPQQKQSSKKKKEENVAGDITNKPLIIWKNIDRITERLQFHAIIDASNRKTARFWFVAAPVNDLGLFKYSVSNVRIYVNLRRLKCLKTKKPY